MFNLYPIHNINRVTGSSLPYFPSWNGILSLHGTVSWITSYKRAWKYTIFPFWWCPTVQLRFSTDNIMEVLCVRLQLPHYRWSLLMPVYSNLLPNWIGTCSQLAKLNGTYSQLAKLNGTYSQLAKLNGTYSQLAKLNGTCSLRSAITVENSVCGEMVN